ncbi:hypothetical protein DACRYDRAFT_95915 [Dacryopinax primogenitus]|uniref:SMAD/FHA domain-containing protein n=1 Tax=Dacryopinax primogenitus (strain DJM 731) TaxID=1858805 RepID=M5FTT6_DACPD|nr:uncharacterized protein DACRYDRAFT_95915 [Dacryopinax primogenitus]EJT99538.1 hypothetical protein DACRYDRAFT_95915 [Dacryopinax primogenitus]
MAPNGHATPGTAGNPHRLRLVPYLENTRSLIFDPILRQLTDGQAPIRIGRFTDRRSTRGTGDDDGKIAFRSKVVSRAHAEVWCEPSGKVLLRDTQSSSGTFLNHIRLSAPSVESRPFPVKDGDVIQLGVDYQGGTEEIYRCVKIRVELDRHVGGREAFNENAIAQLNALAAAPIATVATVASTAAPAPTADDSPKKPSITECSICISSVTVCQALFIAPCSHVFHYKCIRPLVEKRYPGFMCPMCRSYADLDADVDDEDYGLPAKAAVPVPAAEHLDDHPAPPASQELAHPAPEVSVVEIEDQDMDEVAVENEALGNGGMEEEDVDVVAAISDPFDGSPATQEEELEDEDLIEEREVEATASNSSTSTNPGPPPPPFRMSMLIPTAGPSRSHPDAARDADRERLDENATPMNNLFLSTLADTSSRRTRVSNISNGAALNANGVTLLTPIPSVSSIAPSFVVRSEDTPQAQTRASQRRKGKRRAPTSDDVPPERERERKQQRDRRTVIDLDAEDDEDEDAVMVEG